MQVKLYYFIIGIKTVHKEANENYEWKDCNLFGENAKYKRKLKNKDHYDVLTDFKSH